MRILLGTTCLTLALGIGAASACDWQKSVTASAAPPPSQEQAAPAGATSVDPVVLAALDKAAEAEQAVQSK
jgi:hypothetical protein